MQRFIAWLKGSPEAAPFVDMDQGWQIVAVRFGDCLHIRQVDPDDDDEYANVSVPFETFMRMASEVEERAIEIISSLSNIIGSDVWTKYLQDTNFGTSEWQPNK